MERNPRWILLGLLALLAAAPARGAESKCPLEISACLGMYERMKERPWLGIHVERDSLGHSVIRGFLDGSPSRKAGLKVGDVLESIDGLPPGTWFANKAGWKHGESAEVKVRRGGKERSLQLACQAIPEATLASIVGVHMLEGHLAYMHPEAAREDTR